MPYEPTREAISAHRAPAWFEDAKLGIFVHWGLYSVPGWAPTTGPLHDVVAAEGWEGWFARNPYAEWYANSLRIPGSPTAQYHAAHYPADFAYESFAEEFNAATATWDPAPWADLFAAAGARYAVLTTKHHDGFLLWPSAHPNPRTPGYQAARDVVGDLTAAVRARGLTMGLYYSGGLDWTFNETPIRDLNDLVRAVPQGDDYVAYAGVHLRELIARYAPEVLWNDIGYPNTANLFDLFAHYYNSVPRGAINDRFVQATPPPEASAGTLTDVGALPLPVHWDFRTPEYTSYDTIVHQKWESTRGLGFSFGYNRNETPANLLTAEELIHSFVDIVSKNGNLLINVGPMADGTIPAEQQQRLRALGAWLAVNGPAIYGTRPWTRAEGRIADGPAVRFTQRDGALYAVVLEAPRAAEVVLEEIVAGRQGATVHLLGQEGALDWRQTHAGLAVTLPTSNLPGGPAYTLQIRPLPL